MPDVMNPLLYRKLKRHFGRVEVSHPLEAMSCRAVRVARDAPRLAILHAGEYYNVCCPYCGDTRFRLTINHRYGQRDAFGRRMTFLACCFNETACMSRPENRADLWDTLSSVDDLVECDIRPGREVREEDRVALPPGPTIRLDDLPAHHKARDYLESRGFDPDRLGRAYGVSYCVDSHLFMARERIIVPVVERGALRGWQARHVGELPWGQSRGRSLPPKYFTMPGMRKTRLLYNFDRAKLYRTGVIVEGPSDVWRLGPMAVCTFGCTMSDVQRRRFLSVFRHRTAILLYDPEALDEPQVVRLAGRLRARMGDDRFAVVRLPDGCDPGSLGRETLRDFVAGEAEGQGVRVSWKKE